MKRLKVLMPHLSALVLLLSLSACSVPTASISTECPRFYPIETKELQVPSQMKAFTLVHWVRDENLPDMTAECKFHNRLDGSHDQKDTLIMSIIDYSDHLNYDYYLREDILKHNLRVNKFNSYYSQENPSK